MFTVKAEVHSDVGPHSFCLYQAASLRVGKSRVAGANGPGAPAFVAPELEVTLFDVDGKPLDTLDVGQGLEHFSAVYVMNDRGKTVERIYSPNNLRPINLNQAAA